MSNVDQPPTSAIAVIIVNYCAADLAIEAVESVLGRGHAGRRVDVHLLDNASPTGDGDILRAAATSRDWGERVTVYTETTNHGFGRGNNLVLNRLAGQSAPPEYVFLLNPDARLGNDAIAVLAEFLDADQSTAVAGPRISKPGDVPVTAAFRFPGIISEFSGALAFGPVARALSRWQVPLPTDLPTGEVDWVSGAAAMMRFDVVRQMEGFDPAFFLYYEELELMHRLKRAGHRIWHVAEAEVIHIEGASTNVKFGEGVRKRKPSYWYHSWQHYFRTTHGRVYALVAGFAWMLGAALNHVLARLRGRQPAAPLHLFGDFWAMAVRPLLGLKARPYD